MHKWEKAAWRFIWTQRRDELVKAVARYPNSDRLEKRKAELAELNEKLENLDKE